MGNLETVKVFEDGRELCRRRGSSCYYVRRKLDEKPPEDRPNTVRDARGTVYIGRFASAEIAAFYADKF